MTEDIAISVRNLGKRYRRNAGPKHNSLRDVLQEKLTTLLTLGLKRPKKDYFWALSDANFDIKKGENVGIIGLNGAGKSTLLKVLSRIVTPTTGEARITGRLGALLEVGTGFHPELTGRENTYLYGSILGMTRAEVTEKFDAIVEFAEIRDFIDTPVKRYSSGMYVRLAFSVAAHLDPDILLLDEPTNHLDVEAILWLERFLQSYRGAVLFVSHDRAFIRRVATRIVELDRGRLTGWPGSYDEYLVRKAEALRVEAEQNALFDKRLAQEEVWIRKGIEARRTRNEGRVRALHALREERRQRRDRAGTARLQLQEAQASGKLVFEVENLTHGFDGEPLIRDFSLRVMRGDRLALLGPNGAGKTTLLRLLLGQLEPATGSVRQGTRLEVAYFDQQRAQLDPEATVMENVTGGSDTVVVGGQRRHVSGWLQDFLFPPERLNSPVSMLSGGERNRLLLARLFAQPANLLVMDEPTNDLDVETLELLEERIADFNGTLLLVSHDREFVDRVATSVLAFEGRGRVSEYVGGFSDWLRQRPAPARTGGGSSGEASPAADQRTRQKNAGWNWPNWSRADFFPARFTRSGRTRQPGPARCAGPVFRCAPASPGFFPRRAIPRHCRPPATGYRPGPVRQRQWLHQTVRARPSAAR